MVADITTTIEITVIAIIYVIFIVGVQRKLVDQKHMYEVQEIVKAKSKELSDLAKTNADRDQLLAKQKEITSLLGESMRSQLKPTFVVLPTFLIVYYLLFPAIYPADPSVLVMGFSMDYRTYFVALAFVLGLILSFGLMARDRWKMKKEKGQHASPGPEAKTA